MRSIILHIIFILLLIAQKSIGQNLVASLNKDSLLQQLSIHKEEDTDKVLLLIKIGNVYERNLPDSAIYYYSMAGDISKRINYPVGTLKYISNYTGVLNVGDKYFESLQMNLQAVALAKKINNPLQLACAYANTAASYYGLKDYTKCADYFLRSSVIIEKLGDKTRLVVLDGNLTGLYNELKEYDKSYQFGLKTIALARELNDTYSLSEALENTGTTLVGMNKYDSALLLMQQAKAISVTNDDKLEEVNVGMGIADIYFDQQRFEEMKAVAEETMKTAVVINNKECYSTGLVFLARYYFNKEEYAIAKKYADEALVIGQKNGLIQVEENAYSMLSDANIGLGDMSHFYAYRQSHDSIRDVIVSAAIVKNTQEFEAKYSLQQKQAEINDLNKEKLIQQLTIKESHIAAIALALILGILSIAGILFYRNTQQKRKLQQQRIVELEQEKQLLAADAVLQGQEEERTRLAKDLHDGLGGILSSTKYSFNNMKNNFIITAESAAAFDKTMAMLDKSISELRSISHNMMPEALIEFGLDTALKDFCNSINQSGAIIVTYQSFEVNDETISTTTASVIYRVIQELLNNILKHAQATTALVQLVRKNNNLSITVEDNGKGFDKNLLQNSTGIGLKNLQNRIAYLNGTLDVETAAGKGSSVNIEIPNITHA